jgi:hypothetical protein
MADMIQQRGAFLSKEQKLPNVVFMLGSKLLLGGAPEG